MASWTKQHPGARRAWGVQEVECGRKEAGASTRVKPGQPGRQALLGKQKGVPEQCQARGDQEEINTMVVLRLASLREVESQKASRWAGSLYLAQPQQAWLKTATRSKCAQRSEETRPWGILILNTEKHLVKAWPITLRKENFHVQDNLNQLPTHARSCTIIQPCTYMNKEACM